MEPNTLAQNPIQPPTPVQQPIELNPLPVKKSLPKLPLIIAGLLLILAFGAGIYYLGQKTASKPIQKAQVTNSPTATPTPDPTANWKTYTNSGIGYSFKYPADWQETHWENNLQGQNYFTDTLEKDGYKITLAEIYGVGGAINRYVAKAEIANINNLASTTKAYINMDPACSFDSEASPSIPPSTCTETFNRISILNSNDVKNTEVENMNVITTTREYPCFVGPTHRFDISLDTPTPINISDINSNSYVATYNQILSTLKFTQ